MNLIDVLIAEQINDVFVDALFNRAGVDLTFLHDDPDGGEEVPGGESPAVRLRTAGGQSVLVSPRRMSHEVGATITEIAAYEDLTGYDWISRDMADKVENKDEHYDRLYLYLRGGETRVLNRLGPAVYPLMTFLGKVLELRSQKVLLRQMDDDVVDLLGRCLTAAAEGPFFEDTELGELLGHDRHSIQVVAFMWPRLNLASPDLHRTVVGVVELLLRRRGRFEVAWEALIEAPPARVEGALEVFKTVVA